MPTPGTRKMTGLASRIGGRIVMLAVVVVARVVGAVVFERLVEAGNDRVDVRLGRIEFDDQRADLGAQEMVGAGGAERAERPQIASS